MLNPLVFLVWSTRVYQPADLGQGRWLEAFTNTYHRIEGDGGLGIALGQDHTSPHGAGVRQLRHHFGPFSTRFSAPPRAPCQVRQSIEDVASKRERVRVTRGDRDEVTVDAGGRCLAEVVVSPARDTAVASQR